MRIDQELKDRLEKWHEQIVVLQKAERDYLSLKANEKIVFGSMFVKVDGSVKEKESLVYASEEWKTFSNNLVEAEVLYMKARRDLDLKIKTYEAVYLTYKLENDYIKRGRE